MPLRQDLLTDPVGISLPFRCVGRAAGAVVDPVGDFGRTDRAVSAEPNAMDPFRNASRLTSHANDVVMLPGAYVGSVCGRRLRAATSGLAAAAA